MGSTELITSLAGDPRKAIEMMHSLTPEVMIYPMHPQPCTCSTFLLNPYVLIHASVACKGI